MPSLYSRLISISSSCKYQITRAQCRLSLRESDNWFCEFDDDWNRRKRLHHIQDQRNRNTDIRQLFFQNNWEPTIHCPFEQRIGNTGDGGKWVCNIHQLQQKNVTPLIYSFGSKDDFGFERALKGELPTAEIHTFDLETYICPLNICIFHQVYAGDGKKNGTTSLKKVIYELRHQKREIDILKADIEGSEFIFFEEFLKAPKGVENSIAHEYSMSSMPYIRQILFEIHLEPNKDEEHSRRAHRLFEMFRSNNYAIFHKEPNLGDGQNLVEYGLLRLNAAFFIKPP
ncbi:unnamed protein product [Rotaria socialis]|uniref:Methyltransferase domain-containing protein n=1 Tax=Rotaria socialis TaxID=392032 RepID=A0A821TZ50_9BILA|nr:unnamed protein product [Rotaria socialis]CAF3345094.1 unnamed protein product [Rotaria socialis]CAF3404123.1 unnamed protein product [Rotaria socialis]CAF3430163.1 unnamed protein product [Rotaria socialis]CAF3539655.1 unnamed protein product [Rotaria socialis]